MVVNNKEHAALKKVLHVVLKKKQLAALKIMKNKDAVVDIIIMMLHMIMLITTMKLITPIIIITKQIITIMITTTTTVVVDMIIVTIITTMIITLESTYLSYQNKNKKKRISLLNPANLLTQSTQILLFPILLVMKSRVSRQEDKKTASMLWSLLALYARHAQLDPSQRKLTTKELCFSVVKLVTASILSLTI